jgi:hypothetical protein
VRAPKFLERTYDWLRYDLPARIDRGVAAIAAGVVVGAVLIWALISGPLGGDEEPDPEVREVTVAVESDNPEETPVGTLGFPLVATRNTTRVSGPDPTADAAATALATHPPAPSGNPIEAAILVPEGNWQAGIAASALAGPPLRAPILIGEAGGVPEPTALALAQLKPRGGAGPADVAVYRVGEVSAPSGLQSDQLKGSNVAELASEVDALRQDLLKVEPAHIVIASSDRAAYAMPAASWAARSGDPVLFTGKDRVPEETVAALRRHQGSAVYVLGPPSVISEDALSEITEIAPNAQRIGAEDPVANAIAFARYSDSSFGWNINDPGHGMVMASASRPLDAAAAASLSASGKWGPLLITETPNALPPDLRAFLLDIKPGFEEDPTRAVYNHIWLIGDASAIGASVQAEIDDLAELAQIGGGAAPTTDSQPGTAAPGGHDEPDQAQQDQQQQDQQPQGGKGKP